MRVSPIPCLADDALENSGRYADALLAKYAREDMRPSEVPGICRFAFEESYTIDEDVEGAVAKQTAARILPSLTPREERVIRLRFGIGTDEQDFEEIAAEFNVSHQRIRQIEAKALHKLRSPKCWSKVALKAISAKSVANVERAEWPNPSPIRRLPPRRPPSPRVFNYPRHPSTVEVGGHMVTICIDRWERGDEAHTTATGKSGPYAYFYHGGQEWVAAIEEILPWPAAA